MKISLTRRYRFAASHRLALPQLSEEENQRVYGKCNNPYGHGHNYVVEVTRDRAGDPATGMIANLGDLDAFVEREVIEPFDHKYLNEEMAEFRRAVPTTENLCMRDLPSAQDVSRRRGWSACGWKRRARTVLNMPEMRRSARDSPRRH